MNNKLMDLNNVLFEQLERLQEAESNEELETELTKVGVGIARVATFRKEDDT